jgi:hypothetical protein
VLWMLNSIRACSGTRGNSHRLTLRLARGATRIVWQRPLKFCPAICGSRGRFCREVLRNGQSTRKEKMPNETRRVYLAFQGGGAKGIAHIGGLAAVNGSSIEIAGVAGTSAGAIVAALVAAGYSAKDIFDREERSHILQRLASLTVSHN